MKNWIGIAGLCLFVTTLIAEENFDAWTKALILSPKGSMISQKYFDTALVAKNPHEQILWYTKALEEDSHFLEAFVNRGIAHGKNAEFAEALLDFESAIAIDSKDPLPYVNRAYALLLQQNYSGALLSYNQAITLDPTNALIHNSRAYAYYLMGDFAAALEDYDQAITLNPREPLFHSNRERLKSHLGDESGAKLKAEKETQQSLVGVSHLKIATEGKFNSHA